MARWLGEDHNSNTRGESSETLQSLLDASTVDAKLNIIQRHPELLAADTLAHLKVEVQRIWQCGDPAGAEEVYRIQRLLERVQMIGIPATRRELSLPIERVTDANILLDRSMTPLRTPRAVLELVELLAEEPVNADEVEQLLKAHADLLCPPLAPAIIRHTAEQARSVDGGGSPLRYEHTALLLEAYYAGKEIRPLISAWWPNKADVLKELAPLERAALEYSSAGTWEEAYHYVRTRQSVLFSKEAISYLNSQLRQMSASGERDIAKQVWRRLRVLLRAMIEGIDASFARYVWNRAAEQIWESPSEVGLMEAAQVQPGDIGPLIFLMLTLGDGDQDKANAIIADNRDFFRQQWVTHYARYMAEQDRAEHTGMAELWENLAVWFEQLRRAPW